MANIDGIYVVVAALMAKAASKVYLSVLNTSTKIIEVRRVEVHQTVTAAVTGLVRGYQLVAITAHSGGTVVPAAQIAKTDSALADPVGTAVNVRKDGVTITAAPQSALGIASLCEDETGGSPTAILWDAERIGGPIRLRQNQGVAIQQDNVAGVGLLSAIIHVRVR